MARRRRTQEPDALFLGLLLLAILFYALPLGGKVALGCLLALWAAAYVLYFRERDRRLQQSGIWEIDGMGGKEFEHRIELLFRHSDYDQVELTPYSKDAGVDLVVTKNGIRMAVQLKRLNRAAGPEGVREVLAAMTRYGCGAGLVVTNQRFTKLAKQLAQDNRVQLWDREELIRHLLKEKKI